jgi:hypothetical protein
MKEAFVMFLLGVFFAALYDFFIRGIAPIRVFITFSIAMNILFICTIFYILTVL